MRPVFPAYVVTRAQARKFGDLPDLSNSFLNASDDSVSPFVENEKCESVTVDELPDVADLCLAVDKKELIQAQKSIPTLATCFSAASDNQNSSQGGTYLFHDGVLMRKWSPLSGMVCDTVIQVVVPKKFRVQVSSLAHYHKLSGHLGITKIHHCVLRYFFWLGLKSDVIKYCHSCHVCQVAGKPNQVIPPAPLNPIPVIGEQFEHVILDCVGPLPKTKSGNQ